LATFQPDPDAVTRKKTPVRRRSKSSVSFVDWLALLAVIAVAVSLLVLAVFRQAALGGAVLAIAAVGLFGWWWWHHSAYHGRSAAKPSRQPKPQRARRPRPAGRKR
jgi:protein-S-isoprenylcysteine O-methyltransferase Ste14